MKSKTLSVNRKRYATGLFWQPLASGVVARNYARGLAHSVNKKLNLYTDFRGMVGLGARKFGHRGGMPSLAAEVVAAFDEYSSFLAVFQADRGFYLVAVRNGIILQDKVFESETDARGEYVKLSAIPDWAAFIAPAAWGMPRATERMLADVVGTGAGAYLHSISRFRTLGFSVFLALVFIVGLAMVFGESFRQMRTSRPDVSALDPERAAEYRRQVEEKNRELDAQFEIEKPLPPEPIVAPYDNLPDPMARAQLCYQAIDFLMQPITGWNQVSASCGETHVTADVRRTFGTVAGFEEIAAEKMPGLYVQKRSDDYLIIRAALPGIVTFTSQDERDAETVLRDVISAFQSMDADVTAEIESEFLTNGVDTLDVNMVHVAASSKLTPVAFMEIFDQFGGVYMSRAEWVASGRTWNYEVIIYAK